MGSRVVPIRLDKEVLEAVDELVRLGVFSSRSEALRELIRTGVERYRGLARIARAVERLREIEEEEGDVPVKLSGALKQLLEERTAG